MAFDVIRGMINQRGDPNIALRTTERTPSMTCLSGQEQEHRVLITLCFRVLLVLSAWFSV
jgi:hypothetical protein